MLRLLATENQPLILAKTREITRTAMKFEDTFRVWMRIRSDSIHTHLFCPKSFPHLDVKE